LVELAHVQDFDSVYLCEPGPGPDRKVREKELQEEMARLNSMPAFTLQSWALIAVHKLAALLRHYASDSRLKMVRGIRF
jgi:hypothetical protein